MYLVYCSICFACVLFRIFAPISEVGLEFSFLVLCVCFWCQGCKSWMSRVWSVPSFLFSAVHYRRAGLFVSPKSGKTHFNSVWANCWGFVGRFLISDIFYRLCPIRVFIFFLIPHCLIIFS